MMTEEGMVLDRINKIYRIGKATELRQEEHEGHEARDDWTVNEKKFMALFIA